jgi:hypothetical protein
MATLVSSLMGQIFDMTQSVFDAIETGYRGWEDAEYDFSRSGSTRYIPNGYWTQDFRDKLNYSAMVTDYGLAEIFSTLLCASGTVQSAGINLSSTGTLSLSGANFQNVCAVKNTTVATPSLAVQEAANGIEIGIVAGELGALGMNVAYGIKARVNASDEEPELEDL